MTEQDKEYLRHLFAGFKSTTGANAEECYKFADEMLEAGNKEEAGIVSIKRKYERKVNE
jgi:hypothetical protein